MGSINPIAQWRRSSAVALTLFALAIVLVPLFGEEYAARGTRLAIENASREAELMREVYDFGFAFRSLQVNAQNVILVGDTPELVDRYETSKRLTSEGVTALAPVSQLWATPDEPVQLRAALDKKSALLDEAIAAFREGDEVRWRRRLSESAADFGSRRIFFNMMVSQRARVDDANARAAGTHRTTRYYAWGGAALQLLLITAAAWTIWRESTRRAHSEREIADLAGRLEEKVTALSAANEELQAFSYHVAHDLRAPLRHIAVQLSRLDGAVNRHGDETEKRAHNGIGRSVERMGKLIDGLLEYARLGRAQVQYGSVDTGALVAAMIAQERAVNTGRQVEYKLVRLPVVPGDQILLQSVFQNLLENALKFTSTRGRATITVAAEPIDDGSAYRFEVADNGVGFRQEDASQLFGVFRQLHGRGEFPGSGVGLAMVRRIVERHGGRVWAEGVPEQGARFYFTLPTKAPRVGVSEEAQ